MEKIIATSDKRISFKKSDYIYHYVLVDQSKIILHLSGRDVRECVFTNRADCIKASSEIIEQINPINIIASLDGMISFKLEDYEFHKIILGDNNTSPQIYLKLKNFEKIIIYFVKNEDSKKASLEIISQLQNTKQEIEDDTKI